MFVENTKDRLMRVFEKPKYTYTDKPAIQLQNRFGIYINIPFCKSSCKFCPFYKEAYKPEDVQRYIPLLVKEILDSPVSGSPEWIYFGGGTPNLLTDPQLERVVDALKTKVKTYHLGIEVHPAHVDIKYIDELKRIGFSKISFGVESLVSDVVYKSGRENVSSSHVFHIIHHAQETGMFVNVDMMVGLYGQTKNIFLEDVRLLSKSNVRQITLYPFLVLDNRRAEAVMSDGLQYQLIEKAATYLEDHGYTRRGPWTFTLKTSSIYDSWGDEMAFDYVGFGAGSISSYGKWKVVNPTYQKYMHNIIKGRNRALIANKTKNYEDWRKFARMIYDLRLQTSVTFSPLMNVYVKLMQMNGYGRDGYLSRKGIYFAHELTKTAIESQPFPLQNPAKITNYKTYMMEVN